MDGDNIDVMVKGKGEEMRRTFLFLFVVFMIFGGWAETTNVVASQCWAITRSGNRCKRRAIPNARYCRQHSDVRISSKTVERCRSMTTNDVQCREVPLPNSSYCKDHFK